jgi:hypothetical protein
MKKNILTLIPAFLFVLGFTTVSFSGCNKEKEPKYYDIYENHNISACGVDDPLQNIEWLREYCNGVNETQDFSSVYISLYKIIDTDESLFKINFTYSGLNDSSLSSSEYWRNCAGDTVFHWLGDLVHADPSSYYDFMEDKKLVSELFHFVKP